MEKKSDSHQCSKNTKEPIFIETNELSTEVPTFPQFQAVRDEIEYRQMNNDQYSNKTDESIDIKTEKLDLSIPIFKI